MLLLVTVSTIPSASTAEVGPYAIASLRLLRTPPVFTNLHSAISLALMCTCNEVSPASMYVVLCQNATYIYASQQQFDATCI